MKNTNFKIKKFFPNYSITQLLNYFPRRRREGFTLIEILVAITIIGVLATLLMANLQGMRGRARDATRKSDLKQLKTALRMYYNDNQAYPGDDGSGGIDGFTWGDQFDDGGTTIYMKTLPNDPLGSGDYSQYFYDYIDDESFQLVACLENASDSDADATKNGNCGSGTEASYTVTAD